MHDTYILVWALFTFIISVSCIKALYIDKKKVSILVVVAITLAISYIVLASIILIMVVKNEL